MIYRLRRSDQITDALVSALRSVLNLKLPCLSATYYIKDKHRTILDRLLVTLIYLADLHSVLLVPTVSAQMAIFGDFFGSCICSEPRAAPFRPAF